MPPLQVPKSNEKVAEIDEHIGCAMSGLTADARTLVDHGRNATQVCYPVNSASARRAPDTSISGVSCNRLAMAFEVRNHEKLCFERHVCCALTATPLHLQRAHAGGVVHPVAL